MSHSTIFVKDSIDFNENLATFIGDRGAEKFLIDRFGINSPQYQQYINEDKDFLKFSDHMLRAAGMLDSLYKTMKETDSLAHKLTLKKSMIEKIVTSLDTLTLTTSTNKPSSRYKDNLPNNAYFMNFRRYQSKQDIFWNEYNQKFKGELKAYIGYLSDKYPFL
jgi:predicted aminopeptidase